MDQEYWTSEHADKMEENIDEAQRILDVLETSQKAHEKGGIYYKTTKELLEVYRSLRFDAINEKMLKVVEAADAFDRTEQNLMVTLDNILSMPGVYDYYSKEIERFISSSVPVTMGLFVHVIDTGIRLLQFSERKETELKYSELLKAIYIDEVKDPQSLFEQFHTNRSTFYRKKDEAITALSIIIFGPLGGRHPTSLYDDNILMKKFFRFVEMSDMIDMVADLSSVTVKHEKAREAIEDDPDTEDVEFVEEGEGNEE